jgi:hypothetical protein
MTWPPVNETKEEYYERYKASRKAYYQRNKEAVKARSLASHNADKERRNAIRSARHREMRKTDPRIRMWHSAKSRARKSGRPFTIQIDDIVIPAHCPVFGVKMEQSTSRSYPWAPSLDRIDSSRGYEPGNIRVICYRANHLKNNATLEEIEAIARYMRLTHPEQARDNTGAEF